MFVHRGHSKPEPAVLSNFGSVISTAEGALSFAPVRRHRDKELIYAQGDKSGGLYVVEYGCVRVSRMTAEGRRLVTSFNFAGEIFGFEAGPERDCYAEALEVSGTRVIAAATQSTTALLDLYLANYRRVQSHLMILGTQNAIERVAAFLADLSDRQGGGLVIRLPMSRSDIADHLGLTLETVSRAIHRLQTLGLIELITVRAIRLKCISALLAAGCQD